MSKIPLGQRLYHAKNTLTYQYRSGKQVNRVKNSKFIKTYGLFMEKDGVLYGYSENSFSMSWERNYVSLETELQLDSLRKTMADYRKKGKNVFILRLGRKDKKMPIRVLFSKRKDDWLHAIKNNHSTKYVWRNVPFIMKDKEELK